MGRPRWVCGQQGGKRSCGGRRPVSVLQQACDASNYIRVPGTLLGAYENARYAQTGRSRVNVAQASARLLKAGHQASRLLPPPRLLRVLHQLQQAAASQRRASSVHGSKAIHLLATISDSSGGSTRDALVQALQHKSGQVVANLPGGGREGWFNRSTWTQISGGSSSKGTSGSSMLHELAHESTSRAAQQQPHVFHQQLAHDQGHVIMNALQHHLGVGFQAAEQACRGA